VRLSLELCVGPRPRGSARGRGQTGSRSRALQDRFAGPPPHLDFIAGRPFPFRCTLIAALLHSMLLTPSARRRRFVVFFLHSWSSFFDSWSSFCPPLKSLPHELPAGPSWFLRCSASPLLSLGAYPLSVVAAKTFVFLQRSQFGSVFSCQTIAMIPPHIWFLQFASHYHSARFFFKSAVFNSHDFSQMTFIALC
jgi:hypothetical protein